MNTNTIVQTNDSLVTISPARVDVPAPDKRYAGVADSNMARFWELRGRKVFEHHGIIWGEYKGGFFSQLPYQRHLDLGQDEIDSLLREKSLRGVRFTSLTRPGAPGGTYMIRPAGYGMECVSRKQKTSLKTGLDSCEMRAVDPAELLVEGPQLNRDTMARQERRDENLLDPVKWRQLVDAVAKCPGMAVHGAFHEGILAAYLISIREGNWLHLLYKMSRASTLEFRPNHALDFWVLQQASGMPGVQYVSNGATSVTPNEGLDRYKRQMGYGVAEHKLCVHFHPTLAPFISNGITVSLARTVARAFPKKDRLGYHATILETSWKSRHPAEAAESGSNDGCQQEEADAFSGLRRPASLFPALRIFQTLRKGGVKLTLKRTNDYVCAIAKGTRPKKAVARRPETPEEVLNLQPGDWVEVKPMEDIMATLDQRHKNRGLLFTDDMKGFTGKRFRVFKRVESIFLEESKQRRSLKNTVLLDSAYCPGITFRCDRSCFLFWKEVWLRRVDGPGTDQPRA